MRTPPTRYRRSVLDLSKAQAGDVSARDAAGRDINVQGLDPAEALAFIREYIWEADAARERALTRVADALSLHEIGERQRREADAKERRRRQRILNVWLAVITGAVMALAWETFDGAQRLRSLLDGVALIGSLWP